MMNVMGWLMDYKHFPQVKPLGYGQFNTKVKVEGKNNMVPKEI